MASRLLVGGLAAAGVGLLWAHRITRAHSRRLSSKAASPILAKGRVAVITGASSGIGLAVAKACSKIGMRVCLADVDDKDLKKAEEACVQLSSEGKSSILAVHTDVGDLGQVRKLKEIVYERFGEVAFLFNNAGIGGGAGPFEHIDRWREVIQVNLWGVVNMVDAFTQAMIDQKTPAIIVNTGSKQGITCPPGDTAYNISKSGVKILTEGLEHKLRNLPGCQVKALLLVPGWVNTSIGLKTERRLLGSLFDESKVRHHEGKPAAGAWMPNQIVDVLFKAIREEGPFYLICPDNETSNEKFDFAIKWSADDLLLRRPPLSRWHKDYKDEYARLTKDL